ncbi:unnamed protein product [Hymenolepis diminuta]|uniref:14_3_3 domain-containing protein n=1 Tax=Hymenolepis diminuta TaxID=6216 RepID=A0A0R3SQH0_HYMDI|nr:unnamed protein product [Hymenolepis diminuta]VUZ42364.1 unnamed protein product [Hymenolepis diminuta]
MEQETNALTEHNELARIYEVLEMYPDMVSEVKKVVELREAAGEQMTMDERYRLSIAYKHITGRLRTTYRATVDILPKARTEQIGQLVQRVQDKLKADILANCQDVIRLLANQTVTQDEGGVFLLKLRGDYLRYQSEVDMTNEEFKEKAREAYNEATSVASEVLTPTNPVRLGLALNHSVFLYEIADDHNAACQMAHATLQEAVANLGEAKKEGQPEVCIILQLLRDNLSIWSSDSAADE